MSEIFPYPLTPCRRGPWPELRPFYDLSESLSLAQRIVDLIEPFFRLVPEAFTLNGFAREVGPDDGKPNANGPWLFVQLWNGNSLFRTAAFRDTGIVGTVNVEVRDDSYGIRDTLEQDIVGCIHYGLTQTRFVGLGYESTSVCFVADEEFTVTAPWKT